MRRLAVVGAIAAILGFAGSADAQTAQLTLESVFGQPATALAIAFGAIDVDCIAPPAAGVTCTQAAGGASATWYGTIRLTVRVTRFGGNRVRLVGARQAAGTMPAGALRDGAAGSVPTAVYPIDPSSLTLASAIGSGQSTLNRAIGIRLTPGDASGVWSTPVVYSLIVE